MKTKLINFIQKEYGLVPDYPFKDDWADCAVFRNALNKKWFAIFMKVDYSKLGINKTGKCNILNLKSDPYVSCFLREKAGILPAYHMNKTHWNTILLDGTVEFYGICEMVDSSYRLTIPKRALTSSTTKSSVK